MGELGTALEKRRARKVVSMSWSDTLGEQDAVKGLGAEVRAPHWRANCGVPYGMIGMMMGAQNASDLATVTDLFRERDHVAPCRRRRLRRDDCGSSNSCLAMSEEARSRTSLRTTLSDDDEPSCRPPTLIPRPTT